MIRLTSADESVKLPTTSDPSEKTMSTTVSPRSSILIRVPAALAGALVILATFSLLLLGGVLKNSPGFDLQQSSTASADVSELTEADVELDGDPESEADPEESSENELCLPWALSAEPCFALGEPLAKLATSDLIDQWKRSGLKRPPRG